MGHRLVAAPFHEKAVAQAAKHPHEPKAAGTLDPAPVVVMGDIQTLVHGFNSPILSVELKPPQRREFFGTGAGKQRNFFVFAPGGLTHQSRRLTGKRKAPFFGPNPLRPDGAAFLSAFVFFLGAGLVRRRSLRGKNPPWGREPLGECGPERWAGCPWPSTNNLPRPPSRVHDL